jgi:hypothetical protein
MDQTEWTTFLTVGDLAPDSREHVVNVDRVVVEDRVIDRLARAEVLGLFSEQQRVETLVGGTVAGAHRVESVGAEVRSAT